MLNAILSSVTKQRPIEKGSSSDTGKLSSGSGTPALIRTGAMNAEQMYGSDYLVSTGKLGELVTQELKKNRLHPYAVKVLTELEKGHIDLARSIAIDPEFISFSEGFVSSGQLPVAALKYGHNDLVIELKSRGYVIPANILSTAAREGSSDTVRSVLTSRLFDINHASLDLWVLVHRRMQEEANILVNAVPALMNYRALVGTDSLLSDAGLVKEAVEQALLDSDDSLACLVSGFNLNVIDSSLVRLAIDKSCMQFLKTTWESSFRPKKFKTMSSVEQQAFSEVISINPTLEGFLVSNKVEEAGFVIDWPRALEEPGILQLLMRFNQEELSIKILQKGDLIPTFFDFQSALESQQLSLAIHMLKYSSPRLALHSPQSQRRLIKYLSKSETILPAVEMLSAIPLKSWHVELTKELCSSLSAFARKSSEIVTCKAPLLLCTKVAELMKNLSQASLQHKTRCEYIMESYIELGAVLQDAYKDENELNFALSQLDSSGHSVLTLCSKNHFYRLLEHGEIGTIVSKMWKGSKRNHGVLNASTIVSSTRTQSGSVESRQFRGRMDKARPYLFQLEQWTESCSQRFTAQSFSTAWLVVMYQMVIYTAIQADSFDNVANNPNSLIWLRASQVWIGGIMAEQINNLIFGIKSGRGYEIDNWRVLDFSLFSLMILIMVGIQNYIMGSGNLIESIPPEFFNALLHSTMMILIWARLMSSLIPSKTLGPFLRMTYLMFGSLLDFFVIVGCLLICSSAVFTALFNKSDNYISFSYSFRTLFGAWLSAFDINGFNEHLSLGSILLGLFMLVANVMLLNLLIAQLTEVYASIIKRVDSEQRAVIIGYYNRISWHSSYGFLIFLPTPLSYVVLALSPALIYSKDTELMNTKLCKIAYILYAIPQYLYFLIGSICYMPLLYCKGFKILGKTPPIRQAIVSGTSNLAEQVFDQDSQPFNCKQAMPWTFKGPFLMGWALIRDTKDFWANIYSSSGSQAYEVDLTEHILTFKMLKDVNRLLIFCERSSLTQITVAELTENWMRLDQTSGEHFAEYGVEATSRKQLATEFFSQFADSRKLSIIDLSLMRKVIPDKPLYTDDDLAVVKHVHINWINKAVKNYHSKVGATSNMNSDLAKSLTSSEPVSMEQLFTLQRTVRDLELKYQDTVNATKAVRTAIQEQRRYIQLMRREEAS